MDKKLSVSLSGYKLMEHSWLGNSGCKYIYDQLAGPRKGDRVLWIGDYTEQGDVLGVDTRYLYDNTPTHKVFSFDEKYRSRHNCKKGFLVNYDKETYVSMRTYIRTTNLLTIESSWVINPLPLLTACSNGRGGGDYRGSNSTLVGSWAGDHIGFIDDIKELDFGIFTETTLVFIEPSNFKN